MKKLFSKHLKPFFVFTLLLGIVLFFNKEGVVLFINSLRTSFLDLFFTSVTHFGDGLLIIPFLFVVLRYKLKWLAIFVLAFTLHVIFVHIFKQGIMDGAMRPYSYFDAQSKLNMLSFIDGVKIRKSDTFPSGHTATAFFLASFFALKIKNKTVTIVLFMTALLVGISRIYLLQHFHTDVYFGMLFGITSTALAHKFIKKNRKAWHRKKVVVSFYKPNKPEIVLQQTV